MALDATVGGVSANSYVTLDEADLYFEDRVYASDWVSFTDTEQVLITSSQMLDWYINWKGTKTAQTQNLKWPRTGALRPDGTEVDDDVIPPEVKVATYELALSSLTEDRTLEDPLAGINYLKVASLAIKASGAGVDSTTKKVIPEKVYKILSDLYVNSTAVVRLLRA